MIHLRALSLLALPALLLVAACSEKQETMPVPESPPADVAKGLARSVADVEAAEKAAAIPLPRAEIDIGDMVTDDGA